MLWLLLLFEDQTHYLRSSHGSAHAFGTIPSLMPRNNRKLSSLRICSESALP
ncbi:Hypothetical protein Cp1002B_0585 [Corynebacterium pseudotuberculosis]|nr:Hypothetical protein CpPAT10_0559a [Corynebacterium pseudotuberculosis PAT10]AFF21712.1 Hypothetical protein CpP54B96_0565 [Corynebacterium pseudotuberculosis P54B96]AFH51485.1 Hypothetical protein Cp267_0580 [Corynebacterium pseudotuberculosis 267]AJC13292.1 Hypothetical protein CpVD57_0569 [Corynebacterium pseudotuberculosis]AKJ55229.1 Hypothetical protein Cp12C_0591 [Corynebacterium pseudotuberculosis]